MPTYTIPKLIPNHPQRTCQNKGIVTYTSYTDTEVIYYTKVNSYCGYMIMLH